MGYDTYFKGEFKLNKKLTKKVQKYLSNLYEDRHEDLEIFPSHNCSWIYDSKSQSIKWDGQERFYNYVEWIIWIIEGILRPRGYVLDGMIHFRGMCVRDQGMIMIENNEVEVNYFIIDEERYAEILEMEKECGYCQIDEEDGDVANK